MRNINPATAGEYAAITDEIKGAPEWRGFDGRQEGQGRKRCKPRLRLKAVDCQRPGPDDADGKACADEGPYEDAACTIVKLTFSKPAPYFHTVMGLWVTFPAKEENITAGGETGGTAPSTRSATAPTS